MSWLARFRTLFTLGQGTVRGLPEPRPGGDPFRLFAEWFEVAKESGIALPEAMSVSTSTPEGVPSSRMMLLKGHGPGGFVFYTNLESRKGSELTANPNVALLLHWRNLLRQIRIEGTVERVPDAESDAYFATRPRGSQIGAWASAQSAVLSDRKELEDRVAEFEKKFAGESVPRPPHWAGLRLTPRRIEFWQGRADRLHDRIVFERTDSGWESSRLAP